MKNALALLIATAVGLAAVPAFALDPFEWTPDTTDARAYEQVRKEHASLLAVLDYPGVFRELQEDLEHARPWSRREGVYRHLHRAMQVLNQRFAGYDTALQSASRRGATLNEFLDARSTGGYAFPCPDGECFVDDFVVRYAELEELPDAKAEDFLHRVRTIGRLLVDLKRPALDKTTTAIHLAKERWETFIERGRSQYPWEALLNGWIFDSTIEHPPLTQLVVAHPGAAVEMTTNELKELRAKEALGIEVLGVIWYRWKNKEDPAVGLNWWGLSGTISARDDLRPGIGALVHYGRMVTLGLSWHDDDRDDQWFDQPPYVLASFDLFQLAKDRVPEYQKKGARVTAAIEALATKR